jgi:hypothetical protein
MSQSPQIETDWKMWGAISDAIRPKKRKPLIPIWIWLPVILGLSVYLGYLFRPKNLSSPFEKYSSHLDTVYTTNTVYVHDTIYLNRNEKDNAIFQQNTYLAHKTQNADLLRQKKQLVAKIKNIQSELFAVQLVFKNEMEKKSADQLSSKKVTANNDLQIKKSSQRIRDESRLDSKFNPVQIPDLFVSNSN